MKKFLPFLFFLSCTLSAGFAQYRELLWTDAFSAPQGQELHGIYGNKNFSFALFAPTGTIDAMGLALADEKGTVTQLTHTFAQPARQVCGAYAAGEQAVVLVEFLHENAGSFKQEIKTYAFGKNGLVQETSLFSFEARNKTHLNKTRFSVSPDRKSALLFAEQPFRAGANEEIQAFIFDAEGKTQHYQFSIDIESKQNVHNYPQLASNGTVYFLKRDKDKAQQFRYLLYAFVPSTGSVSHKNIALANTSISDIRGTVTPSNEFIVAGFTSSENVHEYEGYFLMKFDQDCNQKIRTQGSFDETTFLRFMSKKEYNKNPALTGFFIDHISVAPTGRIYMAAEAYEEKADGKDMFHRYGDVLFVCFSAEGDYKTTFRAGKTQGLNASHTHWASYKTFYSNDTLVLLYNNLAKIEGGKQPEPVLQQVKIHERLVTSKENGQAAPPLEVPKNTPFFYPGSFETSTQGYCLAVFSSLDGKTLRMARLTP